MPGVGTNSWISLAPESAYGSAPGTGQKYLDIINETMKMTKAPKPRLSLRGPSVTGTFPGQKNVDGDVNMELLYGGAFVLALKHAFGGYAFTPNTPVTGANQHVITMADALPTGLTIEVNRGNTPAGKVFQYDGCKINTWELTADADSVATLKLGIIGQDETGNVTASTGSPTLPTYHPLILSHVGTITLCGTASIECKKIIMRGNNNLQRRFLAHDTTREPLRGTELRAVTGEITCEFEDLTLYNKFATDTVGTLLVTFTSPDMVTGTTPYSFKLEAPKLILGETAAPNVDNRGVIDIVYPFICQHSDSTDDQAKITVINADTTY